MIIESQNQDILNSSISSELSKFNSLTKKLQWLSEVEKAFIKHQETGNDLVEYDKKLLKIESDTVNKIADKREQIVDAEEVLKTRKTEIAPAYSVNTKDQLSVNQLVRHVSDSVKLNSTVPQSIIKANNDSSVLLNSLKKDGTDVINNKPALVSTNNDFYEMMKLLAGNEFRDSIKMLKGNDGLDIVIKCNHSLCSAYAKVGEEMRQLLENKGDKVNKLIINGKMILFNQDGKNVDQSEFSAVY